jgi:hypothetical protein
VCINVQICLSDVRFKVFATVTVPPKRLFSQEPRDVTSQKTAFFRFVVAAVVAVWSVMIGPTQPAIMEMIVYAGKYDGCRSLSLVVFRAINSPNLAAG